MSDLIVCEAMGWTYDQLMETPHWFVERVEAWLAAKGRHRRKE